MNVIIRFPESKVKSMENVLVHSFQIYMTIFQIVKVVPGFWTLLHIGDPSFNTTVGEKKPNSTEPCLAKYLFQFPESAICTRSHLELKEPGTQFGREHIVCITSEAANVKI